MLPAGGRVQNPPAGRPRWPRWVATGVAWPPARRVWFPQGGLPEAGRRDNGGSPRCGIRRAARLQARGSGRLRVPAASPGCPDHTRGWGRTWSGSVLSGRSFRDKSPEDMALPHPQSRKDKYRNEDKPDSGSKVWNFFKRTINISEYRNAKDDVNPTDDRPFRCITHRLIPCRREFAASIFQPLTREFWIVSPQKNKRCMLVAVLASVHRKPFSRQGLHRAYFEILPEL